MALKEALAVVSGEGAAGGQGGGNDLELEFFGGALEDVEGLGGVDEVGGERGG